MQYSASLNGAPAYWVSLLPKEAILKTFLLTLILCVLFAISAQASNDSRAFPPDNCSAGSPFMGFTGAAGSNTFCNSGQDILSNAIPTCSDGQQVVKEGGKFVCHSPSNVPACTPGSFLTFDGTTYTCQSTGVATCGNNQVLTFNGTSYYCVNRDATIPVCAANQFLTYNGNYQCAAVIQPSIPSCPSGYFVTGNGSQLYCAALPQTADNSGSLCGLAGTQTIATQGNLVGVGDSTNNTILCKGNDPALSCPLGYTQRSVTLDSGSSVYVGNGDNGYWSTASGAKTWTCVKD